MTLQTNVSITFYNGQPLLSFGLMLSGPNYKSRIIILTKRNKIN